MHKVILVNGSPREAGCTFTALSIIAKKLESLGLCPEIYQLGTDAVNGCMDCGYCSEHRDCILGGRAYKDIRQKMSEASGIIIGSPVYYGGPNGTLCAVLDRIFFSSSELFLNKPSASVVSCRRSGVTASLDRLNKYFSLNNMPIITSQYWNGVHGMSPEEMLTDDEGVQILEKIAINMAWMIESIKKADLAPPQIDEKIFTNFVR